MSRDAPPTQHSRMMSVKKPGDGARPPGLADDIGCVHECQISTSETGAVNPNVALKHAIEFDSVSVAEMPQGPRRSKTEKKRGALGQRIRDLRLARGLTQMELAVEVGISRAHVTKIEIGERPPGRDALHAIATFFGVSMDFLQSGIAQAPQNGRFVEDIEQLALLDLWEAIPRNERPRIARMLRAAAFDKPE